MGLGWVCWNIHQLLVLTNSKREKKHQALFSFLVSCLCDLLFRSFLPLSGKFLGLAPHVGFSIELNPIPCGTTFSELMFRFWFCLVRYRWNQLIEYYALGNDIFVSFTLPTFLVLFSSLRLRRDKIHTSIIIRYHMGLSLKNNIFSFYFFHVK